MGRYLLCGKEAALPYEVEALDIRLYSIEELCYYIYNNLSLIDDDFIDEDLLTFVGNELKYPEIADKIRRFYSSPSDQDACLTMLLSDAGYYCDQELTDFQSRLVRRRRRNGPERMIDRTEALIQKKRYAASIRNCDPVLKDPDGDARIPAEQLNRLIETAADAYGKMFAFDRALVYLEILYDRTREERVLKKIHDVCVISGTELPDRYFSKVPDSLIGEWRADFQAKEIKAAQEVDEAPELQIFFGNPESLQTELNRLLYEKREELRMMME